MKKLLFACFALLTMLGTSKTYAQETPTNGGVYYLYNTESGMFMSRGNNWGTRVVTIPVGTPWQVSVSGGKYTLRMYDLVKEGSTSGFGDNCYSDNGSPIAFTPAGNASGYTLSYNNNYVNAPATAGDVNLNGTASTWQFLTKEQYAAKMAEKTAAQEAAVANSVGITLGGSSLASIVGDATNWTAATTVDPTPTKTAWNVYGVSNRGGNQNQGGYGCEIYQGGGGFSKTITGLKEGIYKVKVKGLKRMVSNGTCYTFGKQEGYVISDAYFTVNGNVVQIADWASACTGNGSPNSVDAAKAIWEAGSGYISEVFCYVGSDGVLNMSAKSEAYWGNSWFLFGGVEYTYYNNTVSDEDAEVLLASVPSGKMKASVLADLNSAKTAFLARKTIQNFNTLSNAIAAANTSIAAYAVATAGIPALDAEFANTNVYTAEAWTTYQNLRTGYNEGTITNEEAQLLAHNPTMAWHGNNYYDDVLLSAWTMGGEQCHEFDKTLMINTWSTEADNKENGSGMHTPFFEYWTGDGNSLGATTLAANVAVPNGYYKLDALVRVRIKNNGGETGYGITLTCDGSDIAKDVCIGQACDDGAPFRYGTFTVPVQVTNGQLAINFNIADDNNISWLAYKNVKYTQLTKAEYDALIGKTDAQIAELVATMPTAPMNKDVKAAMNDAKTALQTTKSLTDYDALVAAIAVANASVAAYEKIGTLVADGNAFETAAKAKFRQDCATIIADYNAGNYLDSECEAKAAEMDAAMVACAKMQAGPNANMTHAIQNHSFESGSLAPWTAANGDDTGVKPLSNGTYACDADGSYVFNTWKNGAMDYDVAQVVTDMPAGIYQLRALYASDANNKATLHANEYNVEATAHADGKGKCVEATLSDIVLVEQGNLTIKMTSGSWFKADDFHLTLVRQLTAADIEEYRHANAEELAAYNAAIAAVEASFGFDKGEVAPYLNVASMEAYEAAKVNLATARATEVVAATQAINALAWNKNTEEVNAIYDGDFSIAENNGAPAGWRSSNNTLGGAYHARTMVDDRLSAFNATNSAFYMRFDGTNSNQGTLYHYDTTTGAYRMPLKAGVTYEVSFDFSGWGQIHNTRFYMTDPAGESSSVDRTPSGRADQNAQPDHVTFDFTPAADGNCAFHVQNPGANANNALVISNIVIKKKVYTIGGVAQKVADVLQNGGQKADVEAVADIVLEKNLDKYTVAYTTVYPDQTNGALADNTVVRGRYNGVDYTNDAAGLDSHFTRVKVNASGFGDAVLAISVYAKNVQIAGSARIVNNNGALVLIPENDMASDVVRVETNGGTSATFYLLPEALPEGVTVTVQTGVADYFSMNVPNVAVGQENIVTVTSSNRTGAWMATIPGTVPFNYLSLAGSHNAGTNGLSATAAKCQSKSIQELLQAGVRALDLRPAGESADALTLQHGSGIIRQKTNIKFTTALGYVKDYLIANPSETVLLLVHNEEGDGTKWGEAVKTCLEGVQDYIKVIDNNMTLNACRGKMIVIARDDVASTNLCGKCGWGSSFSDKTVFYANGNNGTTPWTLVYQDNYENTNTGDHFEEVKRLYNEFIKPNDTNADRIYVNTMNIHNSPETYAKQMNKLFTEDETTFTANTGRWGITMGDYVADDANNRYGLSFLRKVIFHNYDYLYNGLRK